MALVEGLVDDDVAVGHSRYYAHFVRHEDYGGLPRRLFYDAIEVTLELLVDIRQRLVEYQDFGAGNHSTTQQGALQLPARECAYGTVALVVHSHCVQGGLYQAAFIDRYSV